MKKFYIKTQGCKSNQLESAVISEKLTEAGYKKCNKLENCDLYILNSCSVTENADIDAIRLLRHIKTKYPNIMTVFTGCSAQLNYIAQSKVDFIDLILGNDDKFSIVEALAKNESKVTNIFDIKHFNNQIIHTYSNTRGYLKIQDGCNNYCSYCTIPLARGNSRSNTLENILEQVKLYTEIGIKEVVLTGIHIGQWGNDFTTPKKLFNLLEKIEDTDIFRYRLGSLNTLEITDELLSFLAQSKKFCPHFHLSLQSLNDKTLTDMNRKYSAQSCIDLISKIDGTFKLPFIGSDIIVGFPGETDTDFEKTINNVQNSKLSKIHVFPYSVRKNTKAAKMSNQVPEKTKKYRAEILHNIDKLKNEAFINKNLNSTQEVLIEKRLDKYTNLLKGVTRNYLNVYINSDNSELHNTIQNVKILNRNDGKIFCNIIEE